MSGQTFTGDTTLLVAYGGTSTSNFIGDGATETVSGFSFGDIVSGSPLNGATLDVRSGAVVTGPQIQGTAVLQLPAGATVYGAVFTGSAYDSIQGTLNTASVGGTGEVDTEGEVISASINSGGTLRLSEAFPGGYQAFGVTVMAGGTLNIGLSQASGTVLNGGTATVTGEVIPYFGTFAGEAVNTTISNGGSLVVSNNGLDSGTVIGPGGIEHLKPNAISLGVVISGGTLELDYDYPASYFYLLPKSNGQENGAITFSGNGGTLRDDGLVAPTSVISGFNATDHVVLAGVPRDPNATLQVKGDNAIVSAGGQTYILDIVGASSLPLTFGQGGDGANIDIACYCAGTAVMSTEGEVAVETIVPGDLVITADGRAEPVVWVGRRSYAGRFLQGQPHLLPVRIRAGALGRRLPRRDLLVSPNHALLLDGVLVPAAALVDGRRITVEQECQQVDYVHIELARHNVILAEGAAAETFLDDRSRGVFQTCEGTPGTAATFCAPRLADGFAVEAIRRRLAA